MMYADNACVHIRPEKRWTANFLDNSKQDVTQKR